MYPSSSSSTSSHSSIKLTNTSAVVGGGLTRYGSAPGSILTTAVDSVIGPNLGTQVGPSRFFSSSESSSTSDCKPAMAASIDQKTERNGGGGGGGSSSNGSQRSYCINEFATAFNDMKSRNNGGSGGGGEGGGGLSSSPGLVRHRSSPADFLDALTDKGFSMPRNYSGKGGGNSDGITRLNSQLSFTRQDSLPQISEGSEDHGHRKASHSYNTASFGMGSWPDDSSNMFPSPQSKRVKNNNGEIGNGLNIIESQLQFGPSHSALEMAAMESLMEIPQDSTPCKIRAKRGFATHPRSIAERERRTRISGKLKKLQDLVPNMDKQTSYADMLDLAVQHIKGLQTQVQNLHHELESCTCGCKQNT